MKNKKTAKTIDVEELIIKASVVIGLFYMLTDIKPPKIKKTPLLNKAEIKKITDENLQSLTPREEKTIKMYYGLKEQKKHSLKEIALHFDLPIQRVSAILQKSCRKLRGRWKNLDAIIFN